jgi:hypothetical protein
MFLAGWIVLAGAEDYAYRVELATSGNQPAWRAALPAEVHRGVVRADFADLRVVNGAGEAVPFALLSGGEKPATAQPVLPLPLFPVLRNPAASAAGLDLQVRQSADGTLVSLSSKAPAVAGASAPAWWIADASQVTEPLGELRLEWAATDGVAASLRIEGGDDLKTWRVLADRAPLVDLRVDGRALRQDRVEFAPARVRYLRLTIDGQGGPLPIITGLKGVTAVASTEAPRRVVKASGRAAAAQPLEVEFDLGGRFAVDRVGFALPQVNTLSPAEILVRDRPADPWRPLTQTVVYRLAPKVRGGDELKSPPITVGPTTARYWLLRLDARGGGVGQGEVGIEAGYAERHVVFVARGAAPFRLEYGQRVGAGERDARSGAALSLMTLLPGYREGDEWRLPEAVSGTVTTVNPDAVRQTLATDLDLKKLALWSVLVAGVLLLGFFAFRLMRGSGSPGR